ncbi:MAG: hypothetical protein Q8R76_06975 [Candidatus Omnitrophota bacterium]|nr:hypothetical protein [Candidatus Omnitrophota bacterium]
MKTTIKIPDRVRFIVLGVVLAAVVGACLFQTFSDKPKTLQPLVKKNTFLINVRVDFGPAGKEGYDKPLLVEKGTTAAEAAAQIYPVLLGMACCSLRDLVEIGGVRIDPMKNYWWIATVNGSKDFSPTKDKLKKGDRLEWRYIIETQ